MYSYSPFYLTRCMPGIWKNVGSLKYCKEDNTNTGKQHFGSRKQTRHFNLAWNSRWNSKLIKQMSVIKNKSACSANSSVAHAHCSYSSENWNSLRNRKHKCCKRKLIAWKLWKKPKTKQFQDTIIWYFLKP